MYYRLFGNKREFLNGGDHLKILFHFQTVYKQGKSSLESAFIIKSGFKSRVGYNGVCKVVSSILAQDATEQVSQMAEFK